MSTYENRIGEPQLPSLAPPPAPDMMAEVADRAGVAMDAVDAGQARFARPDGQQVTPAGPLAPVLAERLTGSSAEVDAAAQRVTVAADPVLDGRTS